MKEQDLQAWLASDPTLYVRLGEDISKAIAAQLDKQLTTAAEKANEPLSDQGE